MAIVTAAHHRHSFSGRAESGRSQWEFPKVDEYEQQKGFRTPRRGIDEVCDLPAFGARVEKRREELKALFERRVACAIAGRRDPSLAIFPGHVVPSAGCSGTRLSHRNRGILYYDQFRDLLANDAMFYGALDQAHKFKLRPVPSDRWLWKTVPHPVIQYIEFEHGDSAVDSDLLLDELSRKLAQSLLNGDTVEAITLIRRAWHSSSVGVPYSSEAIKQASVWCRRMANLTDRERSLAAMFEIEAYASFISLFDQVEIFAGGRFAGNWIEVGSVPVEQFRPTELCQSERLLEELLNLPSRGFAPIVLNENFGVADGNHRLMATWLWNTLCAVSEYDWELNSRAFQSAIRQFVDSSVMHPVVIHETLRHLGTYLDTPQSARVLNQRIRPLSTRANSVRGLPAVILPEHLSGAVIKDIYESGVAIRRAEPVLYDIMHRTPNTVLPARASYHFTDRALLPWFQVVDSVHRLPKRAGDPIPFPPGCRLR